MVTNFRGMDFVVKYNKLGFRKGVTTMNIEKFVKYIIVDNHVLLRDNTTFIWVNTENISNITKAIFELYKENSIETHTAFSHDLYIEFDHLTEMIGIELSKLPLDILNIKENELIILLHKYDKIAHVN